MALETWIDGRKYFDRAADLARRPALEKERADLAAAAKKTLESEKKGADRRATPAAPAGMKSAIAPTPIPHLAPPAPTAPAPQKGSGR